MMAIEPYEVRRLDDALLALATLQELVMSAPADMDVRKVAELLGLVVSEIQDAFEDFGPLFALLPNGGIA